MPNRSIAEIVKNRGFLTSTPEKTVRAVSVAMRDHKETAVLVVNKKTGRLMGICTEHDLNIKVLAEGLDPLKVKISDVMSHNPISILGNKALSNVLHMMYEGGFRHMPVVNEINQPIGLVSARDALGLEIFQFHKELELRDHIEMML